MLVGHITTLAHFDILYEIRHFIVNYMTSRILLLIFVLITGMSAAGVYQKILNTIDT